MAGYKEDDQHSVRFFLDLFAFYIGFAFSGAVWGGGIEDFIDYEWNLETGLSFIRVYFL